MVAKTVLSGLVAAVAISAAAPAWAYSSAFEVRFDTAAGGEGTGPSSIRPPSDPELPASPVDYLISQGDLYAAGVTGATGPLTITVSCFREDDSDCDLVRDDEGLGVYSGFGDSPDIDGRGPDEGIRFSFSSPDDIKLVRFDVDDIDYNDVAFIEINGEPLSDYEYSVNCFVPDPGPNDECDVFLLEDVVLNDFTIEVKTKKSDFRMEAFKLELHPVQVIPVPAAGLLLGGAMLFGIGGAAMRRRRG